MDRGSKRIIFIWVNQVAGQTGLIRFAMSILEHIHLFWDTFMMRNVGKPTVTNSNVLLVLTLTRLVKKKKKKLLASIKWIENVATANRIYITSLASRHQRSLDSLVLCVYIFYPSNSVKDLLKYSKL